MLSHHRLSLELQTLLPGLRVTLSTSTVDVLDERRPDERTQVDCSAGDASADLTRLRPVSAIRVELLAAPAAQA
jgi:hypothetical protein